MERRRGERRCRAVEEKGRAVIKVKEVMGECKTLVFSLRPLIFSI